ncbi:MAG: hypothetical protein KJ630_23620 [Proteobacteria bacterium]|nr:hypothetical protein [Pseudomonadota bacterium]
MNQLSIPEVHGQAYTRDRRKNGRYREMHLLVITGRGTGKILDIGSDGLSFGCLYHHSFPAIWPLDIIDARGVLLKQLRVRKIWERNLGHPDLTDGFALEIGVEFVGLTPRQENELDILLSMQISIDIKLPCLL